jgi:hypothetical protein
MASNLLRVGNRIINLDNVMTVDLDWRSDKEGVSKVVLQFLLRGIDELDKGQNFAEPWLLVLDGQEAEAVRRHLKKLVPDLLSSPVGGEG